MGSIKKTIITKLLILSAVSIFSAVSVFAGAWHFSAEPLFGFRYGTLGEYVYTPDTNGAYAKLSELDWEMKPLWYYGGKISFGWQGISVSGYAEGFIPAGTGSMYDSDWINLTDVKNDYSVSENHLNGTYSAGLLLGYEFTINRYLSIKPFLGYDYQDIYFSGQNGVGWYGDSQNISWDNEKAKHIDFTGYTLITYHSCEHITWTGFSILSSPVKFFSFSAAFSVSPYTYIEALDYHCYKRSNYFLDIMSSWFSVYKLETSAAYHFAQNFSLNLAVSWLFSSIIYGSDYQASSSSGPWTKALNIQGATSLNYCEASLALRYSFNF